MRYNIFFNLNLRSSNPLYATILAVDQVSVPSSIAIDILMDTMARDRAHMYLFSV